MFPVVLFSCKKGPGQGGSSNIKGKVFAVNYNLNFSAVLDSGYAAKEDIFLIYGDDITYGDDQKTNYDGTFQFQYLRKGKYKLFVYSKDLTKLDSVLGKAPTVALFKEIEITKNKQDIDLGDIKINK